MKNISKILLVGVTVLAGLGLIMSNQVHAEEGAENTTPSGTSISLSPVSKILQISSSSVYDNVFNVNNDGGSSIKVEVYAAPYSYVYSDEEDLYRLGFNNETNFTQISRWITFRDNSGKYVTKANYTIEPGATLEVNYRITTPADIPSGGQYAVIFAHTLSSSTSASGIRTEASPGMIVYGRSTEGDATVSAEISSLEIKRNVTEGKNTRNNVFASAKVKNTGNVDFNAIGTLRVDPIIGFSSYETPATVGRLSVIPETELVLSDEWKETPSFGLYKATWTVTTGDNTETTEMVICLIPPFVIIISIILLTIIIVWIIIMVRKRRERRSRLAV